MRAAADGGMDINGEWVSSGRYKVEVILNEYHSVKETPKGHWITNPLKIYKTWISNTSKKRYAYPTKEEALNSFRIRNMKRLTYLKRDLGNVNEALRLAEQIEL